MYIKKLSCLKLYISSAIYNMHGCTKIHEIKFDRIYFFLKLLVYILFYLLLMFKKFKTRSNAINCMRLCIYRDS